MLRPYRQQWSVVVATSGAEGLQILNEMPIDVVVSDMRMPQMDGATFLREVATHHPGVIRIILTGQSSPDAILRSVGTTHQVLTKPCDAEKLIQTLHRAVGLRTRLSSPSLRELVANIDHLPSVPSLYLDLVAALERDASVREIGELVAKDLAMSTRILQLVNSAYFGLRHPVGNPVQAATYLGVELIRALTLSAHAFSELKSAQAAGLNLAALQDHSQAVASLARHIASDLGLSGATKDLAFMAGLLQDTGRLVLGASRPKVMAQVLRANEEGSRSLIELEIEFFGASHAEIGGYLLELWGLPEDVVETVTFHHELDCFTNRQFSSGAAVYLAAAIVSEATASSSNHHREHTMTSVHEAAEALEMTKHIDGWIAHCEAQTRSAA